MDEDGSLYTSYFLLTTLCLKLAPVLQSGRPSMDEDGSLVTAPYRDFPLHDSLYFVLITIRRGAVAVTPPSTEFSTGTTAQSQSPLASLSTTARRPLQGTSSG